jgi:tRNA uridine 5-carbamoylmethylation protein Kti12
MVAFVGIPARGKTVMAHKLARYLNWTGEVAKGKLMITPLTGFI